MKNLYYGNVNSTGEKENCFLAETNSNCLKKHWLLPFETLLICSVKDGDLVFLPHPPVAIFWIKQYSVLPFLRP